VLTGFERWTSAPTSQSPLFRFSAKASWRRLAKRLAGRRRAETTLTSSWIDQRLAMGTRGHLAYLFYHRQHTPPEQPSPQGTLNL
jgi:hypothetical protein